MKTQSTDPSTKPSASHLIPNSFQVPNFYVDSCLAHLNGSEAKCLLLLARKTFGWHKASDRLSKSQLMRMTGLGNGALDTAMASLVSFGLVTRVSENDKWNHGVEWSLQTDSSLVELEALAERSQRARSKARSKTVSARIARAEKRGGDVQQPDPKTSSDEQEQSGGRDDQQMGSPVDEQMGGPVDHQLTQNPPKPTLQNPPSQTQAGSGGWAGWNFLKIAEQNLLNPRSVLALQERIADEQELSQKFLAWVLYAHTQLGQGLTDPSGVSKAVRSLRAGESAPKAFENLAALGPAGLQALFDANLTRGELGSLPGASTYRMHFSPIPRARRCELYLRLFGTEAPQPIARVQAGETVLGQRLQQQKNKKETIS